MCGGGGYPAHLFFEGVPVSIKQDLTHKLEQIKIVTFVYHPDGSVGAEDLILDVPLRSGGVAKAAMLKGFNEFFYKAAAGSEEDVFDPATLEAIEAQLKDFMEKMGRKRSGLILP